MEKVTIAESVQEILKVLDTRGYKENSLYYKQICFNHIERWFRNHGVSCYNPELAGGIDIQKLTFSDIDWVNGEIHVRQSKTENMLALPLTAGVGQAIQDYILHGRPDSELPNIFLTVKSLHVAFTSRGLYSVFNAARRKMGLPPCSSHGLRRAVGTNLVIAGIPVSTVAQVLGHSDLSATKQYISLDSVHLKQCALDFSKLPERGDGR